MWEAHALRVRLERPEAAIALGATLADGGWADFPLERYEDLEPTLARLRETGSRILEMRLGEADLEKVFVEVMNRA